MGNVIKFPSNQTKLIRQIEDVIMKLIPRGANDSAVQYIRDDVKELVEKYFSDIEFQASFSVPCGTDEQLRDIKNAVEKTITDARDHYIKEKLEMLTEILVLRLKLRTRDN